MAEDTTTFVYASSLTEDAILSFELDSDSGALRPIGRPVELGGAWALQLSPDGKFLYAVGHTKHEIASLAIDPHSGALASLGTMKLDGAVGPEFPSYLFVTPSGRHLLVCDYFRDRLAAYAIADTGCLRGETQAVVSVGSGVQGPREHRVHPHSIQLDPSGRFAVVPLTGADEIRFFAWDPDAGRIGEPALASVKTVGGTGPRHFAFHPSQPVVYFANERGANHSSVTLFEREEGQPVLHERGTWRTIPDSFRSRNAIADLHLTPDARHLYVSNRGHNSLAGYAISPVDGSLRPFGQFPTGSIPTTFAIEASGRFTLCASQGENTISVHRIDAETGRLSEPVVTECRWYGDTRGRAHRTSSAPAPGAGGAPWVVTQTVPR
jgi:6-phosphogluconolactonase